MEPAVAVPPAESSIVTSPVAEPPAASATDDEIYRFQFRGNVGEYYKIWLTNMALTLLTFGVFSAWAKVRSKRYFYANTFLDGVNFEYHAAPLSILAARLIIAAVIIGGSIWVGIDSGRDLLYTTLLAFLLPWALVRGLSFNARNSSYRNIRFSFAKEYRRMYWVYSPLIALYILPLAFINFYNIVTAYEIADYSLALILFVTLLSPIFIRAYHRIKADCHAIGGKRFTFNTPPLMEYYKIIISIFVSFLCSIVFMIPVAKISLIGAILTSFLFITLAGLSVGVALFFLFWNHVTFPGGAFHFHASFWKFLINIQLVNLAATLLSFGLLYPWAKIRKTKFLADNVYIVAAPGAMEKIIGRRGDDEAALGEELEAAEGFDFDVGLI